MTDAPQAGWRVGQSAPLELSLALAITSGSGEGLIPSETRGTQVQQMPAEWNVEWGELLGGRRRGGEVVEYLAVLAGVLLEADYSRATLAMRDLTLDAALGEAIRQAAPFDLSPDAARAPAERLADLVLRL